MLRHKSQMLGLVPVMRHSEVANSIVEGSSPFFLRGSHRGFSPHTRNSLSYTRAGDFLQFYDKLHLI